MHVIDSLMCLTISFYTWLLAVVGQKSDGCIVCRDRPIMLNFNLLCCSARKVDLYYAQNYAHKT